MLDQRAAELFLKNINMMVPWYLMASYAYYQEDDPILSDKFFDDMGKTMLEKWNDINHYHKHFINVDDLRAGTYLGTYPNIVKDALKDLRNAK